MLVSLGQNKKYDEIKYKKIERMFFFQNEIFFVLLELIIIVLRTYIT